MVEVENIYNYHKYDNENEEQYIWRIGQAKDSGVIDMSWEELADIFNKELGNEDKPFSEAAYRKPYQYAKKYYESGVFSNSESSEQVQELRLQIQEFKKEQIKTRDERCELNRLLREQSRKESYRDMIKRMVSENVSPIEINIKTDNDSNFCYSDNDLLVHLTDIHTGIEINNYHNVFNQDVLKERLEHYVKEILKIKSLHNSENCYIVIGEIISGLIHNNLRLQNNMNLIEQFKFISDLIAQILLTLSYEFNNIFVYVTAGNHSRMVAKKTDSLDGENMDILLPFYLSARLQNINNIFICENTKDSEIATFTIRNNIVYSSHGHKDSVKDVVQNFTMMFGEKPDIVLLGHRHTNGMTTVFDTKVIESGCVSGTDNYAQSIRKCNKPEQTVSVINNDGLLCLYDIQL